MHSAGRLACSPVWQHGGSKSSSEVARTGADPSTGWSLLVLPRPSRNRRRFAASDLTGEATGQLVRAEQFSDLVARLLSAQVYALESPLRSFMGAVEVGQRREPLGDHNEGVHKGAPCVLEVDLCVVVPVWTAARCTRRHSAPSTATTASTTSRTSSSRSGVASRGSHHHADPTSQQTWTWIWSCSTSRS